MIEQPLITGQAVPGTARQDTCPICSRLLKKPHKCKPLYGVNVCRKCRNRFASRRQAAYLIDALLWFAIIAFGSYLLGRLTTSENVFIDPSGPMTDWSILQIVLYIALNWLILPMIFCLKDGFGGRSPGKALMGVRVIDASTREPISFSRSLKRNLVLLIPYVGFFGILFTMMKGRRWGDRWANTQVVWEKYQHKVPFDVRGILCTSCGYDLTGNVSGRCPECGTPFESPQTTEIKGNP